MIDLMLSHLAPHICCGCAEYGTILCSNCKYDIESEDFGRCIWCLQPTVRAHQCGTCKAKLGVAAAWAIGERSDALKKLLDRYKFEAQREGAKVLAEMLDEVLPSLDEKMLVTWVPTTASHIRERGFDHAALLARRLARQRNWEASSLLAREHSFSQHQLSRTQRLKAAETAYKVRRTDISRPVLLVDDILTTGATLRACVKRLREAGAPEVYVAIVARQPLGK